MFCDVVHAKSTHFNILAGVQVDRPRGRIGEGVPRMGKAGALLAEGLITSALGAAAAPTV